MISAVLLASLSLAAGPEPRIVTYPDLTPRPLEALYGKGVNQTLAADLPRPPGIPTAQFGTAIAVGDNLVAVGSTLPGGNQVHVYVREGDGYVLDGEFLALSDQFSCSTEISLTVDENRVFVTSPRESDSPPPFPGCAVTAGEGVIFIAERCPNGEWTTVAQIFPSNILGDTGFGTALAVSDNTIAVGSPAEDAGAVRLFELPEDYVRDCDGDGIFDQQLQLTEFQTLTPSDGAKGPGGSSMRFGQALGFSKDKLAIGAPGSIGSTAPGTITVAEQLANNLFGQGAPTSSPVPSAGDGFGSAISISGTTMAVGSPGQDNGTGSAYTFTFGASTLVVPALTIPPPDMTPPGARFGFQLDFFNRGLFVSAPSLFGPTGKGATQGTIVRVDLETAIGEIADSDAGDGLGTTLGGGVTTLAAGAPLAAGSTGRARAIVDTEVLTQIGFE